MMTGPYRIEPGARFLDDQIGIVDVQGMPVCDAHGIDNAKHIVAALNERHARNNASKAADEAREPAGPQYPPGFGRAMMEELLENEDFRKSIPETVDLRAWKAADEARERIATMPGTCCGDGGVHSSTRPVHGEDLLFRQEVLDALDRAADEARISSIARDVADHPESTGIAGWLAKNPRGTLFRIVDGRLVQIADEKP